jgi:hypothetical protein
MSHLPALTDEQALDLLDLQSHIDDDNAIDACHTGFDSYEDFMRDCMDDERNLIDNCLN